MDEMEALQFSKDLRETLQEKRIWCTITEVNEPDLKFIKIEASIKVGLPKLNSPGEAQQ